MAKVFHQIIFDAQSSSCGGAEGSPRFRAADGELLARARASGSLTAWITWLRLVVVVVVRACVRFGDKIWGGSSARIYRAEVFSPGSSLEPGLKTL